MTAGLKDALDAYAAESERSVGIRGKDFGAVLDECLAQNELMRGAYGRIFGAVSAMLDAGMPAGRRRPLVLYGVLSPVCIAAKHTFERQGMGVACLCEPQPAEAGDLYGTPIVAPQALKAEYPGAVVVVCSQDDRAGPDPVLASLGLPPERLIPWAFISLLLSQDTLAVFRPKHPLAPPDALELRKHLDRYSTAYDFFEDDLSKLTVLAWLRKTLCRTCMDVASPCEKYYEAGLIELGEREVFVDGGAYAGESAVDFIRNIESAKGGYARVWSFEPDAAGYARTAGALSRYPNVTVVPKGLWSHDARLPFFEDVGMGSSFVCIPEIGVGGSMAQGVPVTSLDAVFGGLPDAELPTFIKMDIEGAEREALLGGARTIARAKPKLAICAYHKPEDLYALPQTIMRIRGDYRFALRQHEPEMHEIILYAV
jgi:FkbM family methyltransferase